MKKAIYFGAVILIITTALSACGNKKDESKAEQSHTSATVLSNASTQSELFESSESQFTVSEAESVSVSTATSTSTVSEIEPAGALTESHLRTIKSGVYMLKIKNLPYKLGDDIIHTDYICYYKSGGVAIEKTQYGTTERTIILGDVMYSVSSELEKILKSKSGTFYGAQGLPQLVGLKHYEDSVETKSGTLYDIETFRDVDGNLVSFLYQNKQLKKMRSFIPSFDEYAEYDVELKSNYDSKVFELPTDFDIIEFS